MESSTKYAFWFMQKLMIFRIFFEKIRNSKNSKEVPFGFYKLISHLFPCTSHLALCISHLDRMDLMMFGSPIIFFYRFHLLRRFPGIYFEVKQLWSHTFTLRKNGAFRYFFLKIDISVSLSQREPGCKNVIVDRQVFCPLVNFVNFVIKIIVQVPYHFKRISRLTSATI